MSIEQMKTLLLGLTDDELINLINQCVDLICDRLL